MNEHAPSLMEDIKYAGEVSRTHLWGAVIAAAVSLVIPLVGAVAAYSGFQVSKVMTRSWFGLFFAALGLVNLMTWGLWLAGII